MAASDRSSDEERPRKKARHEAQNTIVRQDAFIGTFFPPPTLTKKSRSLLVNDHLDDFPYISPDRKNFKHFTILTHEINDFSKPIASIGAPPSSLREILTMNPQSKKLNALYDELVAGKDEISLKDIATFSAIRFKKIPAKDVLPKFNALLEKWSIDYQDDEEAVVTTLITNRKIPVIPLEYIIEAGACLCRHHSFCNAFLIFKSIQNKKLKTEGTVSHYRDTINGIQKGGHSWAILKTLTGNNESVNIIDSMNWPKPLELHTDRDTLIWAFGQDTVTKMGQLYWRELEPTQPLTPEFKLSQ